MRALRRLIDRLVGRKPPPPSSPVVLVADVAITSADLEWAVAMRRTRAMTCAQIAQHLGGLTPQQVSTMTKGRI